MRWKGPPQAPAGRGDGWLAGAMRSDLFAHLEAETTPGAFALQNRKMLKVDLAGTGGHFYAKQGSMVAYQGQVDFAYEGSGGMSRMFKKAFTGEGMALTKVSGSGDVFLAQDADEIGIVHLEGESVTVNGRNVAAVMWSSTLRSDIRTTATAGALIGRGSGEAYQLALSGQGFVLVQASEGHPVAQQAR